jgi:hypothetical protein
LENGGVSDRFARVGEKARTLPSKVWGETSKKSKKQSRSSQHRSSGETSDRARRDRRFRPTVRDVAAAYASDDAATSGGAMEGSRGGGGMRASRSGDSIAIPVRPWTSATRRGVRVRVEARDRARLDGAMAPTSFASSVRARRSRAC